MYRNKTALFAVAALFTFSITAALDAAARETAVSTESSTTEGTGPAAEETAPSPEIASAPSPEIAPETETASVPETAFVPETAPETGTETAPDAGEGTPSEVENTAVSSPAEPTPSTEAPPPAPDELNMDSGERTYGYAGPRKLLLLLGPGFGLSFFGCSEINDYLENWIDELDAAEADQKSAKMFLAFQPRFSLTFGPIEYVQIQFLGELAWAPKIIKVIGGSSESFHFMRYSTGGTVSGHIPLAQGRRSISFGAGVLFNVMKFKDYTEYAPGYRGVFAFRFYGRKAFSPEIFVEFNWIKADTGADPDGNIPEAVGELSYISGTIGANFYFKVLEKH